jgi:hypothetical protein
MHDQPQQPLTELEALRKENQRLHKHLSALLSEVYVVRAAVEAIYSHENNSDAAGDDNATSCFEMDQAGVLTNALEDCHITLKEDENDSEIIHVYQHDKHLQTFSTAEWQWMYDDGTWPWEHYSDL